MKDKTRNVLGMVAVVVACVCAVGVLFTWSVDLDRECAVLGGVGVVMLFGVLPVLDKTGGER